MSKLTKKRDVLWWSMLILGIVALAAGLGYFAGRFAGVQNPYGADIGHEAGLFLMVAAIGWMLFCICVVGLIVLGIEITYRVLKKERSDD